MKKVPLMMKPGRPDTRHDEWAGCATGWPVCVRFAPGPISECTCTYDDYGDSLHKHADCPVHGSDAVKLAGILEDVEDERAAEADAKAHAPDHYRGEGMTPWDVWKAFDLDPWAANVVKYLCRAGKKEGESDLDDLKKARKYLDYMIKMREEA